MASQLRRRDRRRRQCLFVQRRHPSRSRAERAWRLAGLLHILPGGNVE